MSAPPNNLHENQLATIFMYLLAPLHTYSARVSAPPTVPARFVVPMIYFFFTQSFLGSRALCGRSPSYRRTRAPCTQAPTPPPHSRPLDGVWREVDSTPFYARLLLPIHPMRPLRSRSCCMYCPYIRGPAPLAAGCVQN